MLVCEVLLCHVFALVWQPLFIFTQHNLTVSQKSQKSCVSVLLVCWRCDTTSTMSLCLMITYVHLGKENRIIPGWPSGFLRRGKREELPRDLDFLLSSSPEVPVKYNNNKQLWYEKCPLPYLWGIEDSSRYEGNWSKGWVVCHKKPVQKRAISVPWNCNSFLQRKASCFTIPGANSLPPSQRGSFLLQSYVANWLFWVWSFMAIWWVSASDFVKTNKTPSETNVVA